MIYLNNISFSYNSKSIFSEAKLEIHKGEFMFIVGESGIGKTTLLKLIYFDLFPDKGQIKFDKYDNFSIDKSDIPILRRQIGIVFQDFKLFNDRDVFENIAIPLYISGENKEKIRKKVYDVSSRVGLVDRLKEMPYDLSGGEQQRVSIARAIVNDPLILIADEPTGNLDPFISFEIIKLLDEINIKGTTVLIATHNFDIVRKFGDKRIIQIKKNKFFDVRLKI
jgi:cell division transport system ATP-binding protein